MSWAMRAWGEVWGPVWGPVLVVAGVLALVGVWPGLGETRAMRQYGVLIASL
jgi:hypothetical protein